MPEKNVMVVAGPSGAKSTFGAGLLHHVEKRDDLSIATQIEGNEKDYEERVINRMWSLGKYPKQTKEGYVVTYTIGADSYRIPTTRLKLVDLPGEQQKSILSPDDDVGLVRKIRRGNVPDRDVVEDEYEKNVRPKFDQGQSPDKTALWEVTFLYHYYRAHKVIFLINLHRLIQQTNTNERITLAYDKEEVRHAVENFTDVAVIPTAVDLIKYDPDSGYKPGLFEVVARAILSPDKADENLRDVFERRVGRGVDQRATNVVNYADQQPEVDFFSVAVPAKDPGSNTDDLTPDDSNGGFVVKGFDWVMEWLE